jgi:hypothetical protein
MNHISLILSKAVTSGSGMLNEILASLVVLAGLLE